MEGLIDDVIDLRLELLGKDGTARLEYKFLEDVAEELPGEGVVSRKGAARCRHPLI